MADSGVTSLDLRTTALPTRSAGAALRKKFAIGKFHAQMAATTPTGTRVKWMTSPGTSAGKISPSSRRAHSAW